MVDSTVFVTNVPAFVLMDDLRACFGCCGKVLSIEITGRKPGKIKCFAKVIFYYPEDAQKAVDQSGHLQILDSVLYITKFLPPQGNKTLDIKLKKNVPAIAAAAATTTRSTAVVTTTNNNNNNVATAANIATSSSSNTDTNRTFAAVAATASAATTTVPVIENVTVAPIAKDDCDDCKTMYVGNLPYRMDEFNFKELFDGITYESLTLIYHPDGSCKGYGFAKFKDQATLAEAREALEGTFIENRQITIGKAFVEHERYIK